MNDAGLVDYIKGICGVKDNHLDVRRVRVGEEPAAGIIPTTLHDVTGYVW